MNLRVFFWLFAMKKIKPLMMTDYHTSLISRVERFHGVLVGNLSYSQEIIGGRDVRDYNEISVLITDFSWYA